jgi:putative Ca2+/H+ antiporter (TMEM165/GDT1 family)
MSTFLVAGAEFGDKTQFLALLYGARFKKPVPIILGLMFSTVANHSLAAILGIWFTQVLSETVLRYSLALLFFGIAIWTLKLNDEGIDEKSESRWERFGPFWTSFITFFLAEMGDKTQIATIALAVKYQALAAVIAGTTLGIMVVNSPVILVGRVAAAKIPLRAVRVFAALIFCGMGVLALNGVHF